MTTKPQIKATNAEYVQAAYANGSAGLRQILEPYANQEGGNFSSAFDALINYPAHLNEFLNLANIVSENFTNSLKKWKSPLKEFEKELKYGEGVREYAIRAFQSHTYKTGKDNKNPGDVYKQEVPDVEQLYHVINFEKFWENTENIEVLRRAFAEEYGLSEFQQAAMTTLFNSADYEVYQAMIKAMVDGYKFGKILSVHIEDPAGNANNAKNLVKLIRRTATEFKFYKSNHNVAEVETFTDTGDLFVFITPDVDAEQTVEVLSAAYNMDKAEFMGNVKVVDSFGDTGIKVFMCDRNTLMFYRSLYRVGTAFDERHLALNHYLHYHGVFSLSYFTNAIAFTTDDVNDVTVTKVEVTGAATIAPGATSAYNATVTGDASNSVYWKVIGASSRDTYINSMGMLYAAADEKNLTKLKVVAYAQKNSKIFGTFDVTVNV